MLLWRSELPWFFFCLLIFIFCYLNVFDSCVFSQRSNRLLGFSAVFTHRAKVEKRAEKIKVRFPFSENFWLEIPKTLCVKWWSSWPFTRTSEDRAWRNLKFLHLFKTVALRALLQLNERRKASLTCIRTRNLREFFFGCFCIMVQMIPPKKSKQLWNIIRRC